MRWLLLPVFWAARWFNFHVRRLVRCGRCGQVMKRSAIIESVGACAECYWAMLWSHAKETGKVKW